VLVILDAFGLGRQDSLTYKSSSLTLVLEGTLVLAVLSLVVVGHQLPASIVFFRITPIGLLIFIAWVVGIKLIGKARKDLPWVANFKVAGGQEKPQGHSKGEKDEQAKKENISMGRTIARFFSICNSNPGSGCGVGKKWRWHFCPYRYARCYFWGNRSCCSHFIA